MDNLPKYLSPPPLLKFPPPWERGDFRKEEVENDLDIALVIFLLFIGFWDFLCPALTAIFMIYFIKIVIWWLYVFTLFLKNTGRVDFSEKTVFLGLGCEL